MDIKAGRLYKVSFKHEAGPPSNLADTLTRSVRNSIGAFHDLTSRIGFLRAKLAAGLQEDKIEEYEAKVENAQEEMRRLPSPEMNLQRLLDRIDRNMRLVRRHKARTAVGMIQRAAMNEDPTIGIEGVVSALCREEGLGRSARRPYSMRTLCTIWVPGEEKDERGHVARPIFGNNDPRILGRGETTCSDLDVYTKEEGRAKALARAVKAAGLGENDRIHFGLQAFKKSRRGTVAYFAELKSTR